MDLQSSILNEGARGDVVRRLHRELAIIGLIVPEAERTEGLYGLGTVSTVKRFQEENRIESTGAVDDETARAINAAVNAVTFNIDGKAFSRTRAGVGGLHVTIIDKNVGDSQPSGGIGDVPLARAVTDADGSYRVRFVAANPEQRRKQRLDLQARVYAAAETFLGASDVRYNASNRETLNVMLPEKADTLLPSEHETLIGAVAAHFRGNLRDLEETDDRPHITYLANKTGWDARAVALAALADKFSDASGAPTIPQPYFYALFRAGLPANENTLYHTDAKTLEAVWKKAAEQGVIAATAVDQIPNLVARFQTLSAQKLLTGPALIGASSFKEMLTLSHLNDAQQTQFAQLYATHRADMPTFWKAVSDAFGPNVANRLQLDGQLAYLTLNNAPLIRKLHESAGHDGLTDIVNLAAGGYYRAEKWQQLIGDSAIPSEISGESDKKKQRYAEVLAAQVRLSFPTAVVAQMVKSGETPVTDGLADQVHAFLNQHQGKFEIGLQPVAQFLKRNSGLQAAPEVVREVTRIQRVHQITPSDDAMNVLLNRGLDSAYAVTRYSRDQFIRAFKDKLGGEANARIVYAKSQQIHNLVLNVAFSYLAAGIAPPIGRHSPGGSIEPKPKGSNSQAANAGDVIAYPTLESLFGEMDFCACEHCRSILSPAAYLVDLLLFLDRDKTWADDIASWKSEHGNAPYPFTDAKAWNDAGNPGDTEVSPLQVLLERRPDIQYLPLTCENTNKPLPYIDLVNETLEYFIANDTENLTLKGYQGHTTSADDQPEELLASPQFVRTAAYSTLAGVHFPSPLPFHQPLENLRRYFDRFEAPLPGVMEALRANDTLERPTPADPAHPVEYGWRDILMEELGLSRAEYEILTDSTAVPLWRMYGFSNGTIDADVVVGLSNAKQFARRVGITYEDLFSILKTRFINPNSDLIPKLERLGVSFATLKALKDGHFSNGSPFSASDFNFMLAELAVPPDPVEYGGDIAGWVIQQDNYARIMGLITLAIPVTTWTASKPYALGDCVLRTQPQPGSTLYYECTTAGTSAAVEPEWPTTPGDNSDPDGTVVWTCRNASSCSSFDNLAFRYSDPDPMKFGQNVSAAEFVRLLRFIRLWKKLGWTIEQTDAAICALYRADMAPLDAGDLDTVAKLDERFLALLPRLGIVRRVMEDMNLSVKRDLLPVLAVWSNIGTHGDNALYRQMFLSPAILTQDQVFKDNGYGEFLQDQSQKLLTLGSLQRAVVAGTITVGDVLTTAINGMAVPYKVVATDTTTTILAANIVAAINATTSADPTGLPLNQVILASNSSGVITIKALLLGSSFILACSVSLGATESYTTLNHEPALRAALNLTSDEFSLIAHALGFDETTPLNLANISAIFRRGWLARKLKISVRELLLFIQLTGLDPFAVPDPTNPAILRLISLLQALKERSFKSAVALYLIWNQDLSGKSAPDLAEVKDFARTLRLSFVAIETEFAVVDDPDGGIAQTRIAMVYGADTAAFFFGLLNDTLTVEVEFSDPDGTLLPGPTRQAIENAAGKTDAGIPKIAYDDFRKQLSYSGVLKSETRDVIKVAGGADAAAFNTAMDDLYAKNQAVVDPLFARYPELQSPYNTYVSDTTTSAAEKRSNLLKAILPELVKRRKQQQALQAMSAVANTDLAFTQTFLNAGSAPFPLHAAGHADQPALNDLLAVETSGLSVQFFASDTATGATIQFPDIASKLDYAPPPAGEVGNPLPANPTAPGAAISGVWRGYIEAPENGFFKVLIDADAGAKITLILDGKTVDSVQNATPWQNKNPIELRAGTLYSINLTVEKVINVVRVQWEWDPKGQGRAVIPARYLYSATCFEAFNEAYVRFLKAASLVTGLGLTANEMVYFATHADYRINAQGQIDKNGQGWLNALPDADNLHLTNPAEAAVAKNLNASLLKPLCALLDFARIKADISPSDESLLAVLKDPTTATLKAGGLLFTITRWNQTSLNDLLARFGKKLADLAHIETFQRIYDAYLPLKLLGISASALIDAATNEPSARAVHTFQAALRARYDESDWFNVLKPINDEMRGLQRDALVAYVLHQMRAKSATAHIDTHDKLFEYFLMDVEMEPCMQTSRVRHALSSVQLFIERCFMHLEPRVAPSILEATHWEWMKRYRVWEANRKVFLWPENWLEPELRDDQSPFFKEAMSELLQGDITEDRAAVALGNYLSKLEKVAKLEPCGIYYVEGEPGVVPAVAHVVARTAGAGHKYYYRRRDGEVGAWTPWEEIKLDIEDNPVIPVVWKDRLFLFWLRILKQAPLDPPNPPIAETLDQVNPKEMIPTEAPQLTVQALLCWSEYSNGKWQPTKTSDVSRPIFIDKSVASGPYAFNRSSLKLWAMKAEGESALLLFRSASPSSWFTLYNTHSLPVANEDDKSGMVKSAVSIVDGQPIRSLDTSSDILTVTYWMDLLQHPEDNFPHSVLKAKDGMGSSAVAPLHNLHNMWEAPFFYEDRRHVFYVTPKRVIKPWKRWTGYVTEQNFTHTQVLPLAFNKKQPSGPSPVERFVSEDAYINKQLQMTGTVLYDGVAIGQGGKQLSLIGG